ncbi:MAG: FtsK/SpoIIIE domain-containing protein [Halanaerobiales bacterium]
MEWLPSGRILFEISVVSALILLPIIKIKENKDELDGIMEEFFKNAKLTFDKDKIPSLIDKKVKEGEKLLIYKIPVGWGKSKFEKHREALEHILDGKVKIWNRGNKLFIKALTSKLESMIRYDEKEVVKSIEKLKLGTVIGYERGNKLVTNDFSESGCHLFIGGPTDMGKSSCIRSIIMSMAQSYSPSYLNFYFIDLKKIELPLLEDLDHVIGETATNYKSAVDILLKLCKKIDKRERIIQEINKNSTRKVTKIYDTNIDIPRIVCVIDEVAEFEGDEAVMKLIHRISRLGRAFAIHLIASTQRPTVDVLPGNIKNNFVARLAFACPSKTDSKTIVDNGMAAEIIDESMEDEDSLPKGRGIYKKGSMFREVQIPWISPDRLVTMINKTKKGNSINKEVNKLETKNTKEYRGEKL